MPQFLRDLQVNMRLDALQNQVQPIGDRYALTRYSANLNANLNLYPGAKKDRFGRWLLPNNAVPLTLVPRYIVARSGPAPSGLTLFDYQVDGVINLISSGPGHLLLDDVGLGKTIQVAHFLWLLKQKVTPFIVVGMKSSDSIWVGRDADPFKHYGLRIQRLEHEVPDIEAIDLTCDGFFVNFALVAYWTDFILNWIKPRVIVVDEVHEIRNIRTKATKAILRIARQREIRKRIGLTASPIVNSLVDLYTQLHFIQPGHWGQFVKYGDKQLTSWATRYCGAYEGEFGWVFEGETNVDELRNRLSHCVTRRTHAQIGTGIPAKQRDVVVINKSDIDLTEYYNVEHGKFKGALKPNERGSEIQRLSMMASTLSAAKIPFIVQDVSMLVDRIIAGELSTRRFIVLSYFDKTVKQLTKSLAKVPGLRVVGPYTGLTTGVKRAEILDTFADNSDELTCLCASIKSIGTSTNKLVCADLMLVSDLYYVPNRFIQAEGRLARISQLAKLVRFLYYLVDKTIDTIMFDHIKRKAEIAKITPDNTEGANLVDVLGGALDQDCIADLISELGSISPEMLELA